MNDEQEKKYVYFFGSGKVEGTVKMREILGGKGANLADMTSIGLPVPPGFTISTEACVLLRQRRSVSRRASGRDS